MSGVSRKIPMPGNVPELARAGWKPCDIACKFGVAWSTAYRWFYEHNLSIRKRSPNKKGRMSVAEYRAKYADVIADRTSGMMLRAVAEKHGVTLARVQQIVAAAEVDCRPTRQELNDAQLKKLRRLLDRHPPITWTDVSDKIGISVYVLQRIMKTAGLSKLPAKSATTRKLNQSRVLADVEAGMTYGEIAAAHGVCYTTVLRAVKRARAVAQ